MKNPRFWLFVLALLLLTGCDAGRNIEPKYPRLEYRNSSFNFDPFNREIQIEDGFILNEGHSYDVVETDSGYDVVLHFVPKGGDTNG